MVAMSTRTKREALGRPDRTSGRADRERFQSQDASAPGRTKSARPRIALLFKVLIVLMLLVGAGWELFRWLLLLVTMD